MYIHKIMNEREAARKEPKRNDPSKEGNLEGVYLAQGVPKLESWKEDKHRGETEGSFRAEGT